MPEDRPPKASDNQTRDVFISYSSKNVEAAQSICDKLEKQGLTCFLANRPRDDIPAGENWVEELMKGLLNSKVVLLIMSKEANASIQVQNEIGIAVKNKLAILPVRIQEEEPGVVLEYYLVHRHRLDIIPAPPPLTEDEQQRLVDLIRRLLKGEKLFDPAPANKVPLLSIWVLHSSYKRLQNFLGSISPVEGALWTFLVMFLLFFLPLAISHRIVGTYVPASISELFRAAYNPYFYYPDLNAILFDMVLHPAAYAMLVFFILFIKANENQYLLDKVAYFISTKNVRRTKFWIDLANNFLVRILPLVLAVIYFFYRRNAYVGYGMQEPLLFWASLAVALSVYIIVALAIDTSYIALLIKSSPGSPETQPVDSVEFTIEQAGALARLTIIFIYVMLMCFVEIVVGWKMGELNAVNFLDPTRLVAEIFGGLTILILSIKIFWLWHNRSEIISKAFRRVSASVWLLLALPAVLIILTIKLWLQVY
jgi:hypothetical protein